MQVVHLNILFSEPDVFSVLPEWPTKPPLYFTHYVCNGQIAETGQRAAELYLEACKQSKAKAIKIDNADGIICTVEYTPEGVHRTRNGKVLRNGDVFHVDGFKYELKHKNYQGFLSCCPKESDCSCGKKVAILKLAKEEEQEPDIQTSDIHHTFKPHGQFKAKEEEPKEHDCIKYAKINCHCKEGICERDHLFESMHESEQYGYNQAIDDVLKKFDPVFALAPESGNILEIVKSFKIAFLEIQKLKK